MSPNSIVTAELNYIGEQATKPFIHTRDPSLSRITLDPRTVEIRDARELVSPTIDHEGFQLSNQPLPAIDYSDPAMRQGPYLVALQDLIREATGASRVISDTPLLRQPRGPGASHTAALLVHTDFKPQRAPVRLSESWDRNLSREEGLAETAELMAQSVVSPQPGERRYPRVLAIQAWRPISEPPHDFALAICAIDSIRPEDICHAEFVEELPNSTGDAYRSEAFRAELPVYRYSPRHRWYQVRDMRPDEVMLFLGNDFQNPARCCAAHSAFRNPECPAGSPGRTSIEVRTFAFFEH